VSRMIPCIVSRLMPRIAVVLLTIGGFTIRASAQGGQSAPNLLLIVADDLGIDCVGCYGIAGAPPTPNLDNLAQTGMRFSGLYVNPTCTPTRASVLTGRYAFRTRAAASLGSGQPGIWASEVMISRPLACGGYAVAMIGKWHLGVRFGRVTPNLHGWTHFEGFLDGGIDDPFGWPKVCNGAGYTCADYVLTQQVDAAIAWIQARSSPWALSLMLSLPHTPRHAPPGHLHTQNLAGLNPVTSPLPFHRAMVEAMDTEIGRLLATLGPAVRANTNIVFLGDNGTDNQVVQAPFQSGHAKGALFEQGCHVPLIVNGPAVATPGAVSTQLVSGVDLFPTMLDMCGINYPSPPLASIAQPLDGVSFAGAIGGAPGAGRPFVYSEVEGSLFGQGYCVRTATHRLIRYTRILPQHQELYDLVADPLEQNDLLAAPLTPANQAAFLQLLGFMDQVRQDGWAEQFGTGCPGAAGVPLIRTVTNPCVGQLFVVQLANLLPSCIAAFGYFGLSRREFGTANPPVDLSGIGMPGCLLFVEPQQLCFFFPFSMTSLTLPNTPALYQSELFLQGFAVEPGSNPAGVVASRGLRCVIGH